MPRGDDLDRLQRDLATAERRMMSAAARAAQDALKASVEAGYELRQDVNGKPYKPAKDGHLPQMERSGVLRRAYRYLATAGGAAWLISVIERTGYGQFLRDGTRKMDPRQHIPRPEQPLPASWYARMKAGIDAAVARVWA